MATARAGDTASLYILGFRADGGIFAVEEFNGEGTSEPFAAPIAFGRMGFEGPGSRWIAFAGHF